MMRAAQVKPTGTEPLLHFGHTLADSPERKKRDLNIIRLEAGMERREPAQWDELRVWDPGDG